MRTPEMIKVRPIIVKKSGVWLNLTIPMNVVSTIHNPANEA